MNATRAQIEISKIWTLFGPFMREDGKPSGEELKSIPTVLSLAGKTAIPVEIEGSPILDLSAWLGEVVAGKSAFVYIPFTLLGANGGQASHEGSLEYETFFGVGADWWYEAWVDACCADDTLQTGNAIEDFSHTNHPWHLSLKPGKHLLVIHFIGGSASSTLCVDALEDSEFAEKPLIRPWFAPAGSALESFNSSFGNCDKSEENYSCKPDFKVTCDNAYPDGWECEQNCEKPFQMGAVIGGEFCLLGKGNKHIPITPDLGDFSLQLQIRGDRVFGTMGLEIYFHYDRTTRKGWCLRYDWGIVGNKTNCTQRHKADYVCELFRYDGRLAYGKYESVSVQSLMGNITDLSNCQPLHLSLAANTLRLTHGELAFSEITIPSGFPEMGALAFDQSHSNTKIGAQRISQLVITANARSTPTLLRGQTKTEFPASVHRMISPYYFHTEIITVNGVSILRAKLTGGPSKEPVYIDIDRDRLNEKLRNPYIRIENGRGTEIGKYLLVKGTVGLSDYHWNAHASAMSPADYECPIERDIVFRDLPVESKLFIGYEDYSAEDSLCAAGGPAEALLDGEGNVLYVGKDLTRGSAGVTIVSPPDKKICDRIPSDIPFYGQALAFAQKNHFFINKETISFKVLVFSRDPSIEKQLLRAAVTLEDVFGSVIVPQFEVPFMAADTLPFLPGASEFSTGYFNLPSQKVGVYHIRVKILGAALPEQRRALEVMPENPRDESAPLASGLPQLYPNIISGICGEHFHPWGSDVADICHYNSGGNNYFKVARKWRAPELLHVYGRKFSCWLKPWANTFEKHGFEPNLDLIKQSDSVHKQRLQCPEIRLWLCSSFTGKRFDVLREFVKSGSFKEIKGACLNAQSLESRDNTIGILPEEFDELFTCHKEAWMMFFHAKVRLEVEEQFRQIKNINPRCELFTLGGTLRPYATGYKLGYTWFLLGRRDPRAHYSEYLTGPNGVEDYPYSSGYTIAHGICNVMAAKLEDPNLILYPEIFGINGETKDPRVIFANPPLGQSDPPPGFLTKQFYEYSFAAVWFNGNGFNFWSDHGYQPKTWDRENYQEMLYAYSFISKTKPVKPLRTTAFAYSRAACLAHPDFNETDEEYFMEGSTVNTAEEAVAFAYEEARIDGQLAGFLVRLEDVAGLDSRDIDMLVIPPLCGVSDAEKQALRTLHEKGVALFGFEDASGLEDLFGVRSAPATKISTILGGEHPAAQVFEGAQESTDHELCVVRHITDGAQALLHSESGRPVLTIHETPWGQTAFFTLPPTFVNRARNLCPTQGQRTNSDLIKMATRLAMRIIGNKEAETSDGTLIGFRDDSRHLHIIVSEDRCPEKGKAIRPLVRVKIPGIKKENISSDKVFEIAELNDQEVKLRFSLAPYESAIITIAQFHEGI